MEAWVVWLALGIVCFIIEIFTPGFFFFSFGTAAILTGLIAYFTNNLLLQLVIYAIATFISFLLMKKFAKTIIKPDTEQSNVFALIGKQGIVTKTIPRSGRGYVKIESEEWSAVFDLDIDKIEEGTLVVVQEIEGNKAIVVPKEEK
ncbi:MAG: NfeD family protein [Candidatus Cloacimonetes bacterium]|jgi:membrane protein implicated in regulation of membrane protease activity|nr:NfeD family protein [Candidatus Cloacimonadota bacterium]MDD2649899.1 NfeD family protein [Candidatus Cloacimonadota bacterium]MDD3501688.1 NfeD family protein [Candidatus Cloacimonadota bacterium]